jgi:hypothetical protein
MPKSFTITVKAEQKDGNGTRERKFTATFTGVAAYAFAQEPSFQAFFYQKKYSPDLVRDFNSGDYELTVTEVS